jgi:peroxiredoxin
MAAAPQTELRQGQVIPSFTLPRCDSGEPFDLRSLKPRHDILLIFAHTGECESCRTLIDRFAAQAEMLSGENIAVVLVLRAEKESRWPQFTAVCDPDGRVAETYLRAAGAPSGAGVGLFVTDRWQALREWTVADDASELPPVEAVIELVKGIESECPECAPVASGWGEDQ